MTDILQGLDSDRLAESLIGVSTPEATARILRASEEVRGVTRALAEGAVSEDDVRGFVGQLLVAFQPGVAFAGDIPLGALAVALAPIAGSLTEDFLGELAALRIREVAMSPRIASLMLDERGRSFSGTTSAAFRVSMPVPAPGQRPSLLSPFVVRVGQSDSRHTVAA